MAPRSKDGSTARLVAFPPGVEQGLEGDVWASCTSPQVLRMNWLGHSKFRKTCHWAYLTRQKKDFSSMHS